MTVLFGSTQGRLVPSRNGQVQCFPQADWQQELQIARAVGLDYIEWLVERVHNPANPIWTDDGLVQIRDTTFQSGLVLYSLIDDYLLDVRLGDSAEALAQVLRVIDQAVRLGLRAVVLPLLEASEPSVESLQKSLVRAIRCAAAAAEDGGMTIFLESVLGAPALLDLLDSINHPNVGVCFDTGNRAALGHNICGDICQLGSMIRHVHVKDKDAAGTNVLLGTGLINLREVCEALSSIRYDRAYTFETTRGTDPVATADTHRSMLEDCLAAANAVQRHLPNAKPAQLRQ